MTGMVRYSTIHYVETVKRWSD